MESTLFWNTVNRYYSLKHEDDIKENTKCVICHGNSSAIFSIVSDKNRKLKIDCANKYPCNLEIIIPPFSLLTKELSRQYEMIETLQNKIIEIKNDFIFGYKTEEQTVETFQDLKMILNESITKSQHLFQLLVDIKPNESKINECKTERTELIVLYKSAIKEYKETKSTVTLEKGIEIYKGITVKNNEIMNLSYLYNNVEIFQKKNEVEYKLVQRELPIDFIEMIDLELVKNVDLNKYVQNDTSVRVGKVDEMKELFGDDDDLYSYEPVFPVKKNGLSDSESDDTQDEMEEDEMEDEVEIKKVFKKTKSKNPLKENKPIKIKIIPEGNDESILARELQKVNDMIESSPKISEKKILEKYVMNFFFKKEEGRCLSNFWQCDIIVDNREYSSGECCFHGEKFYRLGMTSEGKRKEELLKYSKKFLKGVCNEKGETVKKQGRGLILTPEELELWKEISIEVQKEICRYKYENYEEVRSFLCESNKILIHPALRSSEEKLKKKIWEGKGVVVDGELMVIGKNMLGNLWMEVRLEC